MTSPHPMESAFGMRPEVGQAVFTREGRELGTVKECASDAFKVDAPMKRDYWLSIGSVLSLDARGVSMDFDEEQLPAFQLDEPGGHASESPILDAAQDTFASEEEKEARRQAQMHDGPRGLSGE